MKLKTLLNAILILSILQLTFSSCNNDKQLICIKKCEFPNEEVFEIVEDMPFFGDNESDLSDYFLPIIEINDIDQISDGTIVLRLIIQDTGEPCLSRVLSSNVPDSSLLGFDPIIDDMPNWTPGKQRDIPRFVYMMVRIKIIDGEIDAIF